MTEYYVCYECEDDDAWDVIDMDTLSRYTISLEEDSVPVVWWSPDMFIRDTPKLVIQKYDTTVVVWYESRLVKIEGVGRIDKAYKEYTGRFVIEYSSETSYSNRYITSMYKVIIGKDGCIPYSTNGEVVDLGICSRDDIKRLVVLG